MPLADSATVTGLPPSIAAVRDDLTPMLTQYADLCASHEDALVLFQVGDFYEAFCEAAEEVARVCEITLTQRSDSTGEYPMAGIPIDNATTYLERLLDSGYRVAIADQIEDAEEATGLVDRSVTQVITPGTVVDADLLGSGTTNYVAAITREPAEPRDGSATQECYGLAAVDVATGECLVTSGDRATIDEELDRIAPAELIRGPGVRTRGANATTDESETGTAPNSEHETDDDHETDSEDETDSEHDTDDDHETDSEDEPGGHLDGRRDRMETIVDDERFAGRTARRRLEPYLPSPEDRFANDAELRATGAVLAYAEYTQGDDGPLAYVTRVHRYDPRNRLRLDAAAQRSLELFENRGLGATEALFDVLDETNCALGRRCLERWLRRPLVDPERIRSRHDAVEWFTAESIVRETVSEGLATAYDLERLVSRVSRGRANARDLRSLHATLEVVPELREVLTTESASDPPCEHLNRLRDRLDPVAEVRELIADAIAADPPQEITDGDVIREGFDDDLDELRRTEREGREWIADLEARERERTGIDSLKVGHTQVHGYYIEVTDANVDLVPENYHRRQTLKNSERFYTPALKEREDEIIGAAERADALEYDLFKQVREAVADVTDRLQALADALAELDALCSLATVSLENDYTRPEIVDPEDTSTEHPDPAAGPHRTPTDGIEIEGGRHPVVERTGEFVPNDADLPRGSVAMITGPNMSGKSTYMRQVALTVVLAQTGSFVPAQKARLPVIDRVFTRIGASDDIAGGQSTFMREMSELTDILHDATPRSLVLLDEVGRGTATTDGRAIARAAVEFIHDELGATTLFATHYHELTDLAEDRENVFNLHFTATRDDGAVTFLHRVVRGASSSSYGVEVAELAGVPDPVVSRSRRLVAAEQRSDRRPDRGDRPDGATSRTEGEVGETPRPTAQEPKPPDRGASVGDSDGDPLTTNEDTVDLTEATIREFLNANERGEIERDTVEPDENGHGEKDAGDDRPGEMSPDALVSTIGDLDIATMTPMEAMNTLYALQRAIER